jgi:hypothetical protein
MFIWEIYEIQTRDLQFLNTLYKDFDENIFIRKPICDLVGKNFILWF